MKCPKNNTNDFFIHATFRYSKLFNYKSLYTLQRHLLVRTSTLIMWKFPSSGLRTSNGANISSPGKWFFSIENDCFWAIIKPKKRQTKDKNIFRSTAMFHGFARTMWPTWHSNSDLTHFLWNKILVHISRGIGLQSLRFFAANDIT